MAAILKKLFLFVIVRHLNRSADFVYHDEDSEEEEGGDSGEDIRMMKYKVYNCFDY